MTSDAYDANGNTIHSGSNGYVYDFENRLIKANAGTPNEVNYRYDGDGNSVAKTVGGVELHEIAKEQMQFYGAVVSFVLPSRSHAERFLSNCRLMIEGQVLGGVTPWPKDAPAGAAI